MNGAFSIAKVARYALSRARVLAAHLPPGAAPLDAQGFAQADILIEDGKLAAIAPIGAADFGDAPILPLGGRIVLPTFVDSHTHLDKGHIWRRAPNPDGTFPGAIETVGRDREANWSAGDVAARMEFSLRAAYAHGTKSLRTHIDSVGPQTRISWPVLAEARERWRGRIDLQASPLFGVDFALDEAHMADIEAMVGAHGSKLLGAVTYMGPRLQDALDALFVLAEKKGWDLDFHVDETADPAARSLGLVAQTAIDRRFAGRILVGHCCSLARQDNDERRRVVELVSRAGLNVVSLPMCNMFLQDREAGRTPRWRGVTALHELRAAGVNVMIASDNTRDSFYAYGDLDMMEVWREGVRILQLDYPFADWASTVFEGPARALGVEAPRLRIGEPADLIVTRARDFTELFARSQADRTVLRSGNPLAERTPDYSALDGLQGLAP